MYIDAHVHVFAPDSLAAPGWPESEMDFRYSWGGFVRARKLLAPSPLMRILPDVLLEVIGTTKSVEACVMLAQDHIYDVREGRVIKCNAASDMYVSNDYVAGAVTKIMKKYGRSAFLGASIHPIRTDAIAELDRVAALGAVLIKWIPSSQNIDLAAYENTPELRARTHAFYERMAELEIPLLCHLGREHTIPPAFHDDAKQAYNDPALLKPLLGIRSAGGKKLKIIGAHCALPAKGDPEIGADGMTVWLKTFLAMMECDEYDNFHADLSAFFSNAAGIHGGNRLEAHRQTILELSKKPTCKGRFHIGSDFPARSALMTPIDFREFDPQAFIKDVRIRNPLDHYMANFLEFGFPDEVMTNAEKVLRLP